MSGEATRYDAIAAMLPPGETILWRATPDRGEMTRSVFRLRGLAIYFGIAAAVIVALALRSGRPAGQAIAEATLLLPFAAAAFGLLTLLGGVTARTTSYTLTTRRLILGIGIAYQMTLSIPLSAITGASLRRGRKGTGDIALRVKDRGGAGYIALWPHARAWRFFKPQPMLRSVPDAEAACEIIGDALVAFNTGPRVRAVPALPPAPAVGHPREAAVA